MAKDQSIVAATPREARLSYMPGLDGLRALAVIAVLIYHAQYSLLPGGFLGVEVFFVISGYLITSLLLKEREQSGRINLPAFWLRRARRLLPAVFLLILSSLVFSVIFLPDEVANLRSDAAASAAYVTNWYFIFSQQSYFEAVGRPSLLKHLWSLAIEEQFYVVWPLLLSLLLSRLRRSHAQALILAGAVASSALMAWFFVPNTDPSRVYFGTDTRAAGLLFGATLAFVWDLQRLPRRLERLPYDLIGLGALAALTVICLSINQFQAELYQGGFAVVDILTVVLIAATVHPRARFGRALLGREPLLWIGLRSYGIYLWHWPVFMLTRPQIDTTLDGAPLFVLRMAATFLLAEISYRFVETPIRHGALGRAWHRLHQTQGRQKRRLVLQWIASTTIMVISLMALGSAVVDARPPAPPDYLSVESINTVRSGDEVPAEPTETATASPTATEEPTATSTPSPTPEDTPAPTATPTSAAVATEPSPVTAATASATPTASETATPTATATATRTATHSAAVVDAPPPPSPTPAPTCVAVSGRVTAIGDSVMIGAGPDMERLICDIEVDAAQSRAVHVAIGVLREQKAAGVLGETIIIHVGNNGIFYSGQFDEIMTVTAGARRVVFVNVKVPREYEGPNNAVIADGVKRHKNAVLVDWYAASAKRPELFWSDGMHLRPEGARLYAEMVAKAIQ